MIRPVQGSVVVALLTVGAVLAFADDDRALTAKDIFLANKCNLCHGVSAVGIEKKKSTSGDAESAKKAPDLSSVGLDKKADWIAKFLLKKETLDGEKHKKLFKGSDAELKTLSMWLESQKAPKKKGSK